MSDDARDPDHRYARGEISREEWARLRGSGSAELTPGRPGMGWWSRDRRRPARPSLGWIALAAVSLAAVLVVWAVAGGLVGPRANTSYGTVTRISATEFSTLNSSATPGLAFVANDSIWFPSGMDRLVIYASPPDHDMSFLIQGLVNPTVHMDAGARIILTVVNLDPDMYHNWALSRSGPPFGTMSMMDSGMMMAMAMQSPASTQGYWSQSVSFTAETGNYWYLCTYPGHASSGMYGSFLVG